MIELYGGNRVIPIKFWNFSAGEPSVRIEDVEAISRYKSFTLKLFFSGPTDIVNMLLVVDAVRNVCRNAKIRLFVPYFPFSRQDRVMSPGEAHGLRVMASLIAQCDFTEIETHDMHSDVGEALFGPGKFKNVSQSEIVDAWLIDSFHYDVIVSPDAGAMKKISKLAKKLNLPYLCASKRRDPATGEITGTDVPDEIKLYSRVLVADDICDGGRTFTELAAAIKSKTDAGLGLYVTHGIFSKGKDVLWEAGYDEIFTEHKLYEWKNQ